MATRIVPGDLARQRARSAWLAACRERIEAIPDGPLETPAELEQRLWAETVRWLPFLAAGATLRRTPQTSTTTSKATSN